MKKRTIPIAVVIMVIVLLLFLIIKISSGKVTYSVDMRDNTYIVSIYSGEGNKIYENTYRIEPIISIIGKDTVVITSGRGDLWNTRFVDGKTGRVSDIYENVSAYNEEIVVYAIYEEGKIKIIIRDIYDKDKLYKEVNDSFPNVAVGSYVIEDAQIVNDQLVYLKYYVGDDGEEKEEYIYLN